MAPLLGLRWLRLGLLAPLATSGSLRLRLLAPLATGGLLGLGLLAPLLARLLLAPATCLLAAVDRVDACHTLVGDVLGPPLTVPVPVLVPAHRVRVPCCRVTHVMPSLGLPGTVALSGRRVAEPR